MPQSPSALLPLPADFPFLEQSWKTLEQIADTYQISKTIALNRAICALSMHLERPWWERPLQYVVRMQGCWLPRWYTLPTICAQDWDNAAPKSYVSLQLSRSSRVYIDSLTKRGYSLEHIVNLALLAYPILSKTRISRAPHLRSVPANVLSA